MPDNATDRLNDAAISAAQAIDVVDIAQPDNAALGRPRCQITRQPRSFP